MGSGGEAGLPSCRCAGCVDDQAATIQLLRDFAFRLKDIAACGAVVIIPLQKGALGLAEFYDLASSLMAPFTISAGLPSNAAAVGSDEVLVFVRSSLPARCHFLGAARNKRFRALLEDVQVKYSIDPERVETLGKGWNESLGGHIDNDRRVQAQWITVNK